MDFEYPDIIEYIAAEDMDRCNCEERVYSLDYDV